MRKFKGGDMVLLRPYNIVGTIVGSEKDKNKHRIYYVKTKTPWSYFPTIIKKRSDYLRKVTVD